MDLNKNWIKQCTTYEIAYTYIPEHPFIIMKEERKNGLMHFFRVLCVLYTLNHTQSWYMSHLWFLICFEYCPIRKGNKAYARTHTHPHLFECQYQFSDRRLRCTIFIYLNITSIDHIKYGNPSYEFQFILG